MSRLLHIEPFGGVAGDMLLGALLDLGVDAARLRGILAGLRLPGWRLEVERTQHQGLAGTRATVLVDEESSPARRLGDVERLFADADLPERVRELSLAAFRRLFAAEAEVHGVAVEAAHLHELAAVDAVVDVVGCVAAVGLLEVDQVSCGPVPVGRGSVATAHGLLPVPPPAVAALLRGVPLADHAADGEMTTPTGAVLVTTLCRDFGAFPHGRLLGTGTGLGTRRFAGLPNVLRTMLLDVSDPLPAGRRLDLVECTLDDATGETIAFLIERACAVGARDAWCLGGTGRKGRPIHELRVLVEPELRDTIVGLLFGEGATLGVRVLSCARPEVERRVVEVETPYGSIPVKVGLLDGLVVSAKPEHDACRKASLAHGVTLSAVVSAARAAAPPVRSALPPKS